MRCPHADELRVDTPRQQPRRVRGQLARLRLLLVLLLHHFFLLAGAQVAASAQPCLRG
jgi:hypothetical protein